MANDPETRIPTAHSSPLHLFVDAGFRLRDAHLESQFRGCSSTMHPAGLGVWIPALATGIALGAEAHDNNEAEALAIALGALLGQILSLQNGVVITDSRLNFENLADTLPLSNVQKIAKQTLTKAGFTLEWHARESTAQADFFASLALEGKNFIAKTANAKNPEEKFRPLLKASRTDKTPLKNIMMKWLSLPSAPLNPPPHQWKGELLLTPEFAELVGTHFPQAEFHLLAGEFLRQTYSKSR